MQIEDVNEDCAVCRVSIDETLGDDTAAHYLTPFSTKIVAWTCDAACSAILEATRDESGTLAVTR